MSNLFTESLFYEWTQTCHFKIKFWAFYETWIRWDNQIFVHKAFLINWWSHLVAWWGEVSVSRWNSYGMSFSVKRVSIPWKLIYYPNILIFLVASCHWQPEIGGHACPRFVRVMSVSAIFWKSHVRVRIRVRDLEIFNVHVRVRVRPSLISVYTYLF